MSEPVLGDAAPETRHRDFLALLFGASAAPLVWLGQVMLGYGVTAYICYPADHPVAIPNGVLLRTSLIGFDILAVVIALVGGITAFRYLERPGKEPRRTLMIRTGRIHFLALWGVFSSLCFLAAILFNIIASIIVPLCVR